MIIRPGPAGAEPAFWGSASCPFPKMKNVRQGFKNERRREARVAELRSLCASRPGHLPSEVEAVPEFDVDLPRVVIVESAEGQAVVE